MSRSLPRLAPVLALTVVLGACGGGSDDEPRAEDPSSASPSPAESESSEPTESPSPTEVEPSGLTPPVSEEAAQGYIQAVTDAAPAFTRFGRQYQRAVDSEDGRALLASARGLRDAIFTFDTEIRSLDLAPVQISLNAVLELTGEIIAKLDLVAKSTSGKEAAQILNAVPYGEFTTAFTELAAQIRGA